MFGLWKSKKRKQEEEKNDLKAIVTEDLLGASEWKESKVGYVTGLSSIGNIAGNVVKGVSQSFGRTALTFKLITKSDNLESLPDVDEDNYDGALRFRAAMQLHKVSKVGIERALVNTRRSFLFYSALTIALVAWFVVDLFLKENMAITTIVLHIAPMPVSIALAFKAAFTNWMFRVERLEKPSVYLNSGDWLPKASK